MSPARSSTFQSRVPPHETILDFGKSSYDPRPRPSIAFVKKLSTPTRIPERPLFLPMEWEEPWAVPGYRRNLPHWRLEGATYFVTFRLADSIPESVARHWHDERVAWLQQHGIEAILAGSDMERLHEAVVTVRLEHRAAFQREQQRQFLIELDKCHGSCVLDTAHTHVAEALLHFHGSRVWTGDFVVMPNHVHVLVQPFPGIPLEEWLYSVKRYSATQILDDPLLAARARLRKDHLWQTESFDRVVRDAAELTRTRRYIARNPARLRPGTYALRQMDWLDEFAPPPDDATPHDQT